MNDYNYILNIIRNGGSIRISTQIEVVDKDGNHCYYLSDATYNTLKWNKEFNRKLNEIYESRY